MDIILLGLMVNHTLPTALHGFISLKNGLLTRLIISMGIDQTIALLISEKLMDVLIDRTNIKHIGIIILDC